MVSGYNEKKRFRLPGKTLCAGAENAFLFIQQVGGFKK